MSAIQYDGTVYSHHHDIARAGSFRFYKNNINSTGTYEIEPVVCDIVSNDLMSKQDLVNKLIEQGYKTTIDKHHADFYYAMRLRVVSNSECMETKLIKEVNEQNSNDSFSPHSPKVLLNTR